MEVNESNVWGLKFSIFIYLFLGGLICCWTCVYTCMYLK